MKNHDVTKPIYEEVKAGGILYKVENEKLLTCIIHRPKIDDWVIPKGHVEERESLQDAAIREVAEETGFDGRIEQLLDLQKYEWSDDEGGRHLCRNYVFLMEYVGESKISMTEEEVDEIVWMGIDEAIDKVSYDGTRGILKQVEELLSQKQIV